MKKSVFIPIIIAIVSIVIINACRKESNGDSKTSLYSQELNQEVIHLNNRIPLQSMKDTGVNFTTTYDYSLNKPLFNAIYQNWNSKALESLCKQITGYTFNPGTIVIYFSGDINKLQNIDNTVVTAISYYTPEGNNYYHRLFVKEGDIYKLDKRFSCKSNISNSANFPMILFEGIPKALETGSYICLRNVNRIPITNGFDGLKLMRTVVINRYLKSISSGPLIGSAIMKNPSNNSFSPPTGGQQGGGGEPHCGPEPSCVGIFTQYCDQWCRNPEEPQPCASVETRAILIDNSELPSPDPYNFSLQYQFRDSFLVNSAIGLKYINYYVLISDIVAENGGFSLAFAVDCANVLPTLNTIQNKLLNASSYPNDTLVNSTFHDDITSLIDDLRGFSTDAYWGNILDDLQNDLDYYEGKTVSQITSIL